MHNKNLPLQFLSIWRQNVQVWCCWTTYLKNINTTYILSSRAYFRKIQRPKIGRFVKKCSFWNCQKQLPVRGGIRPSSALLLNNVALLLWQRPLFQEQFHSVFWFQINNLIFHILFLKSFFTHLFYNTRSIITYML